MYVQRIQDKLDGHAMARNLGLIGLAFGLLLLSLCIIKTAAAQPLPALDGLSDPAASQAQVQLIASQQSRASAGAANATAAAGAQNSLPAAPFSKGIMQQGFLFSGPAFTDAMSKSQQAGPQSYEVFKQQFIEPETKKFQFY